MTRETADANLPIKRDSANGLQASLGRNGQTPPPFVPLAPGKDTFRVASKRVLDLVLPLVSAPVWLPAVYLLGLAVKLADGGPMIYRRRVVGPMGEFDAYKLRTMRVDAEVVLQRDPSLRSEFERNFKLKNDPRLTRVGKLLRKWSLDEIPQLFNVLRGEMSLVGPRMITQPELERYGPYQDLLLRVKPGITGYWQVQGRQEICYEERVRMDVFYIQNWSLWFDFKILLKTVWKVLKREGAY